MKVFERYIFRRALILFIASLVWTVAIVWTTQVLTRINLVTDSGQSAFAFFEIAALILPSVLPVVIPFAMIIAAAQTLNAMNNDSELVVMSAAGGGRSTIVRPIMTLAIIASIVSFSIDNGAEPYARQRGRELVAAARADFLSLVIQEGTFRKIEDGLYIQISERLPDGRLSGIFVADSRTEGTDLIYYAKYGQVREDANGTVLVMQDGEIQRKMPDNDISIIRFMSYAFDLSVFTASAGKPQLHPKDRTLDYLFNPDPDDSFYKNNPASISAELHRRLTDWSYSIVFGLVALAVIGNARSHRDSRINSLATAVIIALVVRWLGYVAADQIQLAPAMWPLVYAVPLFASAVCVWFIATNRTMELPIAVADRVIASARAVGDRLTFMRPRRPDESGGQA
ncbi:MAG: LPS export ABC transporter permease LptF [Rhizobiaceae bacterium]|nr:LPS export ABC transporter permease LptF [Rhizobiaceae bacterium]